jgi:CRISPR-associated protein Csm2
MTRPIYPTNQTGQGPQAPYRRFENQDDETREILARIEKCKNLAEISCEEIAKESGIAEKLAQNYKGKLNTTQLRKFFDKIVTNQENLKNKGWKSIESDFCMIRPNLAYAKGRKLIPDDFFKLISICLKRIAPEGASDDQIKENYSRFVELLQSIVAYSKYYEGR